jgi:hypothetical protein
LIAVQKQLSFYQQLSVFGPSEFMQYSKDELERLHNTRTHMDLSVNDLRRQRDIILCEIER